MLNPFRPRSFSPSGQSARSISQTPALAMAGNRCLSSLKSELRKLGPGSPVLSRLEELQASGLYAEIREWAKAQTEMAGSPDQVLQCQKNAAEAHALTYALQAMVDFGQRYDGFSPACMPVAPADAGAPDTGFLRQIRPHHRESLLDDFSQSFRAESVERQTAIRSALSAALAGKLQAEGILPSCSEGASAAAGPRLDEAELLALLDYVNSRTGTFNALNSTAIARDYYGEPVLASALTVFRSALYGAVDKLCRHPAFGRRDVRAYKGVRLSDTAAGFRLRMLEEALAHRRLIAFPSVLSASSDPDKSYFRTKFDHGYTIELSMTMPVACDVDAFHDLSTKGEQEVLAPAGQRYRVTGKSEQRVLVPERAAEFTGCRYELEPE